MLYEVITKIARFSSIERYMVAKKKYSLEDFERIDAFLDKAQKEKRDQYRRLLLEKDSLYRHLISKFGSKEAFMAFKDKYQNEALEELVLNKREFKQIETSGKQIIQIKHPIYKDPVSDLGRAHFYAPAKRFFGLVIPTPLFNMLNIWVSALLLYVALYLDILRRIINYFETFKLRQLNKRLQKLKT